MTADEGLIESNSTKRNVQAKAIRNERLDSGPYDLFASVASPRLVSPSHCNRVRVMVPYQINYFFSNCYSFVSFRSSFLS